MEKLRTRLLVLIILLMIIFPTTILSLHLSREYVLDIIESESRFDFQLAQEHNGFSLTWTSNWISEPQDVTNNSIIIGDHIVLNATFENQVLGMNITRSEILFTYATGNTTRCSTDYSRIIVDTYYLYRMNCTYDISVIGYTDSNESVTFDWVSITLCNFFAPKLSLLSIAELLEDSRTLNISWSCTDQNKDEINFFEVWLSNNAGESYFPWARNLTDHHYLWNSTGFLKTTYQLKVLAYSHDALRPTTITHIPSDYWPGDYSDCYIQHTGGNVETGGPHIPDLPDPMPTISHPPDIRYLQGTTGHVIIWEITGDGSYEYHVMRNGTFIHRDDWSGEPISISVDGLPAGVFQYRIIIGYYAEDTVMVFVDVFLGPILLTTSLVMLIVTIAFGPKLANRRKRLSIS